MGRHDTSHPRRWATAGLIIGAIALTACADGDHDDAANTAAAPATINAEAAADIGSEGLADQAGADEQTTGRQTGIDLGQVGRDVIVEMHVVMSSADVARSVSAITSDAAALGGGVASSDVDYGVADEASSAPRGHAVLVVRVPPDSVDRLLEGLDATGTVLSINQSAQDVTEQLVDLDVRIANARASVANVRQFMDQTTDLAQLVMLEGELSRRQTELEQLEAQQRNMSERVELATITIEVTATPAAASAESADEDGLADGLRSGWDAFVTVAFAVVYVIAVLAPFLVVALVAAGVGWLVLRRRPVETSHNRVNEASADDAALSDERENASPVR